jgi:hypothetical protein
MKGRDWIWFFVEKSDLATEKRKIVWPAGNFGTDLWVLTVDGTHCWIQEPTHETWSQDRDFYSHKYGKAGNTYV